MATNKSINKMFKEAINKDNLRKAMADPKSRKEIMAILSKIRG